MVIGTENGIGELCSNFDRGYLFSRLPYALSQISLQNISLQAWLTKERE